MYYNIQYSISNKTGVLNFITVRNSLDKIFFGPVFLAHPYIHGDSSLPDHLAFTSIT